MSSSSSQLTCPSHPGADLIEDHRAGDVICSQCGLVVGDRVVDVGTEWRSFNNEKSCKDPSRVGAPENSLLSSGDLSTSIAAGPGASADNSMARLQRRTVNSSDRALMQAMGVIREMSERVHLARSIQDQAARIYKDVLETKQLKGKNPSAVAAACLYIACRKEQVPRTFKEICAISQQVSKKEIGRCFKLILKALETSLEHLTSVDFMSRFCSNLSLDAQKSRQLQLTATHIAKQAFELDCVPGRSPISVAAAAIYLASHALDLDKSAKEIGEIAGAAETTVKNTYKLLLPMAQQLFPDNFNFVVPIARLPLS